MAEKKGFDLAGLMKSVSNLNTREQIEYLPFDRLDPDPNNFYSMDGLDALADSIATVGLVHPLRVRQNGERYTVISGHRRRAAIEMLIHSGEEAWRDRIPCIVDHGEAMPEFTELKLIFANSQRQKTSAELSREAERTEQLLVALREKGYAFPGRMQDHVAQAMQVNASKLKRLHAIRSNLTPELLELYDGGKMNESAAYALQQLPENVQAYLSKKKKMANGVSGQNAELCVKNCETYLHPKCSCPDGSECSHTLPRFYQTLTAAWADCRGVCCLLCRHTESDCPYQCARAKKKTEERRQKDREEKAAAETKRKSRYDKNRSVLAGKYMALAVLCKDAGLKSTDIINLDGAYTVGDLEAKAADPSKISDCNAQNEDVFTKYTYVGRVKEFADLVGVSVDFLLGRTEEPAVNRGEAADGDPDGPPRASAPTGDGEISPRWIPGAPAGLGRYLCLLRGNADRDDEPSKEFTVEMKEDGPWLFERPMMTGFLIVAHWPLPGKGKTV